MKMKIVAGLAFLLNTLLFGSYYSVAKEVLARVDPIVFTFFAMMTLVPPGLIILILSRRHITRSAVKSGFLLGSCLCLGLFTLSVALKQNSATGTAFFPALNGLLAAIFTWLFLRQPIAKWTWFAGIISVTGAVMLMANASMGGARGALIAFLGGLFCSGYIFLADHEQKDPRTYWALFGVELLTMALWANLIALLFGDWQFVKLDVPHDLWVIVYIGLGTQFLPTLFTVWLQKYISPVTVSFIYIMEPIMGALFAYFYLREVLPIDGYLGGALVVVGVLLHTWGTVERPAQRRVSKRSLSNAHVYASWYSALVYPLLCCVIGGFLVYRMSGFPPLAWSELIRVWPQASTLVQQGQGVELGLLIGQAVSWLIAWVAVVVIGAVALYRVLVKLLVGRTAVDKRVGVEGEKRRVERRVRRVRMAQIHYVEDAESIESEDTIPLMPAMSIRQMQGQQVQYQDAFGNHWSWWDDLGTSELRKR